MRHAFAVDPPGSAVPTELQRTIVEKICVEIVRRHLAMPARLMLEMSRPLNYVSAQLLHFFQPLAGIIANIEEYEAFAERIVRPVAFAHRDEGHFAGAEDSVRSADPLLGASGDDVDEFLARGMVVKWVAVPGLHSLRRRPSPSARA